RCIREGLGGQPREAVRSARRARPRFHRDERAFVGNARDSARACDHRGHPRCRSRDDRPRALAMARRSRSARVKPDEPPHAVLPEAAAAAPDVQAAAAGRDLFRYVVAQEWVDYRAIMGVFADTFFSEFTPEDVAFRLAETGHA